MKNQFQLFKFLSICIVVFFSGIILATAKDILWEKSYGGKHANYLFDVVPTPDYGFLLAGSSLSKKTVNKTEDNRGDLDFWVWKMNEKGELDWQKGFVGSGKDILKRVIETPYGGYLLAGISRTLLTADGGVKASGYKSSGKGGVDFWVVKLKDKQKPKVDKKPIEAIPNPAID
ncbi:MAG: hypothetical protein ACOYLP_07445 [Flavobacterium sp.]|uniref:hypothetical protein n=1 Tax=Flavobacterium sp. TaxID=239 RepID=UPI003BE83C60